MQTACRTRTHAGHIEADLLACFTSIGSIITKEIITDGISRVRQILEDDRLSRLPYWMEYTGMVQSTSKVEVVEQNDLFEHAQGSDQFREEVRSKLLSTIVQDIDTCESSGLKKHQQIVTTLLQPVSPVQRLLVHHRVGAGKTRTSIEILDNYFDDPRTKIIICPSDALCQQFYRELLMDKSTNKYKRWVEPKASTLSRRMRVFKDIAECVLPRSKKSPALYEDQGSQSGYTLFRRRNIADAAYLPGPFVVLPIYRVEYILEFLRVPGCDPSGIEHGAQFAHGMVGNNPLSNKIILFDEFHTLFTPESRPRQFEYGGSYGTALVDYALLKTRLTSTTGTVLAALTATLPDAQHDTEMINILTQGMRPTLHGYLHSYTGDEVLFPHKPGLDQLPQYVDIQTDTQLDLEGCERKLSPFRARLYKANDIRYRNMTCRPPYSDTQFTKMYDNLHTYAPKMSKMLVDLYAHLTTGENAIILCDAQTGIDLLERVLQHDQKGYIRISPSASNGYHALTKATRLFKTYLEAIETWEKECLKVLTDHPTQIIIVDTKELAEGLNIRGVTLILGLSEYADNQKMEQAFGRGDRMCTQSLYRNKEVRPVLGRIQYVEKLDGRVAPDQSILEKWMEVENRNRAFGESSF
jgi:hypothetical protein